MGGSWLIREDMSRYPNPYHATGAILILIGIVTFLVLSVKETAILPIVLGCSVVCKGIPLREKLRTEDSYRDRIMGMSFILPGLVQIRDMHRKATGMAMIATYLACYLVLLSVAFSFITVDDVGKRALGIMLVYSLLILFTDILLCAIQSNEFCNQEGLPYIGGEFEGNWTDTGRAYRWTVLAASAVGIAMAVPIMLLRCIIHQGRGEWVPADTARFHTPAMLSGSHPTITGTGWIRCLNPGIRHRITGGRIRSTPGGPMSTPRSRPSLNTSASRPSMQAIG